MPRKVPPIDTDHVIERYLAGESSRQIAPTLGVSPGYIDKLLRNAGVTRSRSEARAVAAAKRGEPAYVDEIVRRYRSGESQAAIGESVGITQASVSRWLIKRGEQISRSEAEARKWAAMTAEQRSAQVAAAHDAVRGMARTEADLRRRALGKERTQAHATDDERRIAAWLAKRGIDSVTQRAVGKYNIDVAAEPVAVELFGGGWHAHGDHRARLPHRTRDIADAGWNTLIVWTHKAHPLGPKVTDELVAYIERSRSDPSFRREYRVVWGDGKFIAAGSVDDDELTLVPTGVRGTYGRS